MNIKVDGRELDRCIVRVFKERRRPDRPERTTITLYLDNLIRRVGKQKIHSIEIEITKETAIEISGAIQDQLKANASGE